MYVSVQNQSGVLLFFSCNVGMPWVENPIQHERGGHREKGGAIEGAVIIRSMHGVIMCYETELSIKPHL